MFDRKYEMDPTTREFRLRLAQMGIAEVVAYLVDWSLPDALIRGAGRDVVEAAVGNLLPERFAEIEAAVDAHAAGIETAREAQKKTSSGATTSAPISTSPDVWVGATSG